MAYILKWQFGPHGSEEDYGNDFECAVADAKKSVEEWWREHVKTNGAESFGDAWKESFADMKAELYRDDVSEKNLVWPVTQQDKDELLAVGEAVFNEEAAGTAVPSAG